MKTLKKKMSILLVLALVLTSLVLDFGQLNANAYENYSGTGVFRVDIVIGVNDCANNTRGTNSKFQIKLLDAGGTVVSQTSADALSGAEGAGDGGTDPLENNATTSFTFNGTANGDVNATVAELGILAVNKTITQVQLVCTTAADDWFFDNVIIYYSPDGGSAWTTLADNAWQASSGTATWSAGTYFTNNYKTLGFNANGGTGGGTYDAIPGQTITVPSAPVREGYTFISWLGAPSRMPAAPTTYFAGWSVNSYTIAFDSSGGSEVSPITNNYGSAVTPPEIPTKTGFTFDGWLPEVPVFMPAGNITCVAQWSINSYTVSFDSDGGSAVSPITQEYGTAVSSPEDPTKEGCTFTGWTPAVPATIPTGNITCVAQWMVNSYTITFNANGGSAVESITQGYGTIVIPPENISRTGYTFAGWLPSVPVTMPAEDITCTAQWDINDYTITFNANGGTLVAPITQNYETIVSAPADPVREGYTFAGWLPLIPDSMPAEDLTCVAQWSVNSYTIIFNFGYDEIIYSTMGFYGSAITAPEPNRPGYTLTGWLPAVPVTMPDYDIVCVAQWSVNSYTITFDTRGGSAVSAVTQIYGSAVTEPDNPTRAGYAFAGWQPAVPSVMPAGDLTCVAQWVIPYYTITWDANGGSGGGQNTCRSGETPEPIDAGTKLGYLFAGWSPIMTPAYSDAVYIAQWVADNRTIFFNSDGGSAVASITQIIGSPVTSPLDPVRTGYTFAGWVPSFPSNMPGIDTTYTAQWIPNTYTIIFDDNGGIGGGEQSLPYGAVPVPPEVIKENYTFDGWEPAVVPVTGDAVYTARWMPNTVTITFNANGGEGGGEQTVNYGQMPDVPVVIRMNYRFAGWSPDVVAAAEAATYTAQWIRLGDLNGSETISSLDALLVLQFAAGLTPLTQAQLLQADVDMNGFVNNIDALKILQFASGLITSF